MRLISWTPQSGSEQYRFSNYTKETYEKVAYSRSILLTKVWPNETFPCTQGNTSMGP
jgi:hypothetical protein